MDYFRIQYLDVTFVETAAVNPSPEDKATDVPLDAALGWQASPAAVVQDIYFGTDFSDVNDASQTHVAPGVLFSRGQDVNTFDPGLMNLDQTYFWRVDGVNDLDPNSPFKGNVWSFTAEPYSIPIPGSTIAATASSVSNDFSTPETTIDGSGLDANGAHDIAAENMWFTAAADLDPWIQYEFDDIMKLDIMTVWNSNGAAESAIGWGVKDVEIAYSVDGENWDVLAGATQFSRASGLPTYDQPDNIAFDGAAAKYVRLNIQSNWGGILMAYGLS
ncbi:MAG: discoidin domain-containing protein, partial [Planctomycetes bacterium]|nr:discoidin domain-containing protein [Planctomycetota bacterium]